jgi:hypothetical protein
MRASSTMNARKGRGAVLVAHPANVVIRDWLDAHVYKQSRRYLQPRRFAVAA